MSGETPRPPIRLGVFMTRGMSLGAWERSGLFDRETALYRRLQAHGVEVGFVTYGGPEERAYAPRLPGMRILCNRWRLAPRLYERLLSWLHARWLRRCDVVKSNQVQGAMAALRAARLWRKPLVARCGYLLSDFQANSEGAEAPSTHAALKMEGEVFSAARRIVVTSTTMAATVITMPTTIRKTASMFRTTATSTGRSRAMQSPSARAQARNREANAAAS